MTATILDGRTLAKTLREELRAEIQEYIASAGAAPTLAVVRWLATRPPSAMFALFAKAATMWGSPVSRMCCRPTPIRLRSKRASRR